MKKILSILILTSIGASFALGQSSGDLSGDDGTPIPPVSTPTPAPTPTPEGNLWRYLNSGGF